MSSARQAVMPGPSFIEDGKRPDLTPFHHVVLLTGMNVSTCCRRKKPVSGIVGTLVILDAFSKVADTRTLNIQSVNGQDYNQCE